ncbi:hypothetical protein IFM89_028212 [Coptis chinensis]|uniref:Protein kinase domain-containing protein n=1 Tax=Coptis chinensis TaxID=261450 RepID=A0A835LKT6_9MAGN|nr:hypothetical protein IFM89_028212 [Coptis chinensis]
MSEPINKEWMSEKERGGTVYSMGVKVFLKFAKWKLGVSNGIEKSYCVWTLHGEDLSNIAVHPPMVANIRETTIGDVAIEMEGTEEETIGEVGIGMGNFVDSSFGLHERVVGDGSLGPEFDEPYVLEQDLGKRYCFRVMECLHSNGIIHRDTSPAKTTPLLRREKKHYDHKVDIYSFSIVLWELLTNLTLFKGMTSIQAAYAVASRSNKYMMMSMAGNGGMNGSNIGNVRNGGAASISAAATAIDHTRFPRRRERVILFMFAFC